MQEYELNLRDYLFIILKRKEIIIFTFLAIFISTVIYISLQPRLYKATAVIRVDPITSQIFQEKQALFGLPTKEDLPYYVKKATSPYVVEKTVKELIQMNKIDTSLLKEWGIRHFIETVSVSISAREIENSRSIRIDMVSRDSLEATEILTKLVEVFKLDNMAEINKQARNVKGFVEERLDIVSTQLKELEEKLKALTLKGVGLDAGFISNKIAELEGRRADLLLRVTNSHPSIMSIEEQLTYLKNRLNNLPKEEFEINNLKRDIAVNERLYNLLREKLQEVQIKESEKLDNLILVSPPVVPQRPFSPNKPVAYILACILGLGLGVCLAFILENMDTSIGKIDDLETITKLSVIGVIPYYPAKVREKKRLFARKKPGKEIKPEGLQRQLVALHQDNSMFLEAFRILGANIQVIFGSGHRIQKKCILITSSSAEEGKSIITANLAIVMAQMGYNTVLVDADLRRSTLHHIFGLKRDKGVTNLLTEDIGIEPITKNIADLLLGEMNPDELMKYSWLDNFHFITAGPNFPNVPYLLNTEKFRIFLAELKEKYDVVILDSSPVLAVSDTSIIAPHTDGILLVYRAGAVSRLALRRAKIQIEGATKNKEMLKGVILNYVKPETSRDVYQYYYRDRYYTMQQDDKAKEPQE